jgi:diguanylate cyclase (GGDEF)-like protein
MIPLDPRETLLFNVGIELFSCALALIVYLRCKKEFPDSYDIQMLSRTEFAVIFVLLADIGTWLLNGRPGRAARFLGYADNILYFLMQLVITFTWMQYAWYRIYGRDMPRRQERCFVTLPFAGLAAIVLISPLNRWCFYLDADNYYARGVLSAPMSAVILLYLLGVSGLALAKYRREAGFERKNELLNIAFFAVPPFVGGAVQTIFYGLTILWPCVVLSSLLILLNKESQVISRDSLTGLNNRRNAERQFSAYEESQPETIALLLLDINDFKGINDQYGHSAGDQALVETAGILRAAFRGTSAFLARYGGDEFIVILPEGGEARAAQAAADIRAGFAAFNRTSRYPFWLSASVGLAACVPPGRGRMAALLKQADADMYADKARYHRGRPGSAR